MSDDVAVYHWTDGTNAQRIFDGRAIVPTPESHWMNWTGGEVVWVTDLEDAKPNDLGLDSWAMQVRITARLPQADLIPMTEVLKTMDDDTSWLTDCCQTKHCSSFAARSLVMSGWTCSIPQTCWEWTTDCCWQLRVFV